MFRDPRVRDPLFVTPVFRDPVFCDPVSRDNDPQPASNLLSRSAKVLTTQVVRHSAKSTMHL